MDAAEASKILATFLVIVAGIVTVGSQEAAPILFLGFILLLLTPLVVMFLGLPGRKNEDQLFVELERKKDAREAAIDRLIAAENAALVDLVPVSSTSEKIKSSYVHVKLGSFRRKP